MRPTIFDRRRFRAVLAVCLLAVVVAAVAASAQDFRLPGLAGGQLTDADLAQGATVVIVWSSWSPKCADIAQRAAAVQSRWGSRARVVTVNFQEDRAVVDKFVREKGLTVPVYLDTDGSFSKKNSVTTLPGLLVVRDGATAFRGRLPDDPDRVLGEILGG